MILDTQQKADSWELAAYQNNHINNTNKGAKKRLVAPYGKRLNNLAVKSVYKNSVYIFVGDSAWKKARAFHMSHYAMALPTNFDPNQYSWPVNNCDVLVFETGNGFLTSESIRQFAYILLEAGAIVVRIILPNGKLIAYKTEARYVH